VLTPHQLQDVLRDGVLDIVGRLVDASNATLVANAALDGVEVSCVYKPTRGERPLWDFPDGTLGRREVATYTVSQAAGLRVVPATVWRTNGPLGAGMAQAWVSPGEGTAAEPGAGLVDVVAPDAVPPGWHAVLDALGADGRPVVLVHADAEPLTRMALLDLIVNNADRKGGHVLLGRTPQDTVDRVYGVDHGVAFNTEDKLRTVLWGWAGQELAPEQLDRLADLAGQLAGPLGAALAELLAPDEVEAIRSRVGRLQAAGRYPVPGGGWPPLPWPAF
jgi:uncharacterized repeat protein (TIGR03843 family)